MYSAILLLSMTTPAEVPAGVFLDRPRAGCAGSVATVRVKVKATVAAAPLQTALVRLDAARPHLLASTVARVAAPRAPAGCAGAQVFAAGAGCAGTPPAGFLRMPSPGPAVTVKVQTGPVVQAPAPVAARPVLFEGRIIRRFLKNQGVSEVQLDRVEVRYGLSSNIWLDLLKAFLQGGLPAVLDLLKTLFPS